MKIVSAIFKTLLLSLAIVAQVNFAYAQSQGAIIPNGKATFLDNNGNPLSSGKVFYYVPSTTTPKTTYQDINQTIPNTNPVVLDAAGRSPAQIWGAGNYRQQVFDQNNNLIWDVTTSTNGTFGNVVVSTGDGDLVGTVKPWAGMTAPNQYMFTYGQQISRSTFSALFSAITSTQSVTCTNTNPTLNGLSDTTNFWIGMTVEVACISGGVSTIISKTSNTVTLAVNANVSQTTNAVFFPWGNGNGTTTFTLPDFRGLIPVGNNIMGGTASTNLSIANFGATTPNASGAQGGNQSTTLTVGNLPNITSSANNNIILNPASSSSNNLAFAAGVSWSWGTGGATGCVAGPCVPTINGANEGNTNSVSGTVPIIVQSQNTTSTPFSIIPPSKTINFIIKVTPDANSATASGVTDINGMTGSIACGVGLTCTGNTISSIGGAVSSVNAKTGAVLIQAGSGVSVDNTGANIIISSGGTKTPVIGNLNFYIATTGNDANAGTIGSPWFSCSKAIQSTQSTYDLGNNASNTITINFGNGTYTYNSSQYCQLNGTYSGQISPSQLIFTAQNPGTLSNVIIQPSSSGSQPLGVPTGSYGFGTAFGSMATISWITFDGRNTANDILNFGGRGSQVHISNIECSLALYPGNCSSIYGQTYLQIDGPVTEAGAGLGVTCTWGSSASSLTSCTGTSNAVVGMGITASNGTIPWPCLVSAVNTGTNVITINCSTTGTGSGTGATVWYGGNAFLAASQGSQVYANTNGAPASQIPIAINSSPYFNQSTLYADNAQISLQAVTWQSNSKPVNQQAISQPTQTRHNGIIDLNGSGFPSVPGSKNAIQTTASVTSGSATASSLGTVTGIVAGMSINGFVPTTTTFSGSVSSITVGCSSCGISVGQPVIHPCVAGGTTVSSGGGGSTTVGLSSPTICASGAGDAIYFTGYAVPNGDVLTSVNTGASTAVMGVAANATVNPVNIVIIGSQTCFGCGTVQ